MFREWLKTHDLKDFHFCPVSIASYKDEAFWQTLDETFKQDIIQQGEAYLHAPPSISATDFMHYFRTGDRAHYEKLFASRRHAMESLVLAECVERRGRFLDELINVIWAICEESFWGIPAHVSTQLLPDITKDEIDLFAASTALKLAWAVQIMRGPLDAVSPLIAQRVEIELERRIRKPFLARTDYFWMGYDFWVSNWNPYILARILGVFALTCVDDQPRMAQAASKVLYCLDAFNLLLHSEGSCDEGPDYWGTGVGSLFEILRTLYDITDGKISFYDEPIIRAVGSYIYRVYIGKRYFVNFADGGSKANLEPAMLFSFGEALGDENMKRLAAVLYRQNPMRALDWIVMRCEHFLLNVGSLQVLKELEAYAKTFDEAPLYFGQTYLADLEIAIVREREGSPEGLYLAAKGGTNVECHNHNDVGSCVVYLDGEPVLLDVGPLSYKKETFVDETRYNIWSLQSQYHNLPTLNGYMQHNDRNAAAREVEYAPAQAGVSFSLELREMYPPQAGVNSYRRVYRLQRGASACVKIEDTYAFSGDSNEVVLNFMTAARPVCENGEIRLQIEGASGAILQYDGALETSVEEIPLTDANLKRYWTFPALYRLQLTARDLPREGKLSVTIYQA